MSKELNLQVLAKFSEVEDYDPDLEKVKIESSQYGKEPVIMYYLPKQIKEKIFRMLHPTGLIRTTEVFPALDNAMPYKEKLDNLLSVPMVIVKTEIFLDKDDNYPVAESVQASTLEDVGDDTPPAMRYAAMYAFATGKAESRALTIAGIGMQYFDKDAVSLEEELSVEGMTESVISEKKPKTYRKAEKDMGIPDDFGTPVPTPTAESKEEIAKEPAEPKSTEEVNPFDFMKIEEKREELPLEEIWEKEIGSEPEYDKVECTNVAYKGKLYADIAKETPDLLLWFAKKDIPNEERRAVAHYIRENETIYKKGQRQLETCKASEKQWLEKTLAM